MSVPARSIRVARTSAVLALALGLMAPAVCVATSSSAVAAVATVAGREHATVVGAVATAGGAGAPPTHPISSLWHELPTATPGGVPTTLTVDATGALWYADFTHAQLVRVSPEGDQRVYALPSPRPHVTSLIAGTDGGVWYADQLHRTIDRLDPVTGLIKSYRINDPRVVADSMVAGADRVWFAAGPAGLGFVLPSGEIDYVRLPAAATPSVGSIDIASDGRVWFTVTGTTSIGVFDPVTAVTEMVDAAAAGAPVARLGDIAVAPDGSYWAGADNLLLHGLPDGSIQATALPARRGEHIEPRSLTLDSAGRVYFTDLTRGIGVLDEYGAVSYVTAPSGAAPWHLALSGETLWFNDLGRSTLGWL